MTVYRTRDGLPGLELGEWQTGELRGVALSRRDLRLVERLRARRGDARVEVEPLDSGVRVSAQGTVGLVRFDGFELRVEPKLPGGHLQLFRMVEFAAGVSGLAELAGSPRMRFRGADLLDLVIGVLSSLTERLIRGGLRADYVTHEDDLPALRGRLLPDRQVLQRLGLWDRVVCRYDEHEQNVPDNQLLARALSRGADVARDPAVRRRARELAATLEDVCDPSLFDTSRDSASIPYDRTNMHYRPAHTLAWLLLDGQGPDETLIAGDAHVRSFLINMNHLFELFVERALRRIFDPSLVRIDAQRRSSIFWDADRSQRYAHVRPDFLLGLTDRAAARLPADAKYKRYGRSDGSPRLGVDDLAQAFLYAYAYRDPEAVGAPPAVLFFPSETPGAPQIVRLEVRSVAERSTDARLTGFGLHIPTLLDEFGGQLVPETVRAIRAVVHPEGRPGPAFGAVHSRT